MNKAETTKKFPKLKRGNGFGVSCSVNRALSIYPLHRHDYIELEILISGRLYQEINGVGILCEPGDCWCLDNRDLHYFRLIEPVKILNICIDLLSVPSAVAEFIGKIKFPLTGHLEGDALKTVKDLFVNLAETSTEDIPFAKEKCTAYMLLLLAVLTENTTVLSEKPEISGYGYISEAIDYMHKNYGEPLSLDRVAREVSLSPKYFSKLFKRVSGHSFVGYLNYLRIERAKELLLSTSLSVTYIAMECGFDSFPTFSRQFKTHCGCTPTAFRGSVPLNR